MMITLHTCVQMFGMHIHMAGIGSETDTGKHNMCRSHLRGFTSFVFIDALINDITQLIIHNGKNKTPIAQNMCGLGGGVGGTSSVARK